MEVTLSNQPVAMALSVARREGRQRLLDLGVKAP